MNNQMNNESIHSVDNTTANEVTSAINQEGSLQCQQNKIQAITVSPEAVTLYQGDSTLLQAIIAPSGVSDEHIVWYSSSGDIATVNHKTGLVYALHPGYTLIRACAQEDERINGVCEVTVLERNVAVTSVVVSSGNQTLDIGESVPLTARVLPANATDKTVRWESSDTAIATVSETTGVVTAKQYGTVTITARSQSNTNVSGTCTVVVCPSVCPSSPTVRVRYSDGNLALRGSPNENGPALGNLKNDADAVLITDTPSNTVWYYVHGTMTDGSVAYGWCSGNNLFKQVRMLKSVDNEAIIIRSAPGTGASKIGKFTHGDKLPLLEVNTVYKDSYYWNKIMYYNTIGYVAEISGSYQITYELVPLVEPTLTRAQIESIRRQIRSCPTDYISSDKRIECAEIAYHLLNEGFPAPFVAGVLANIQREGNCGLFENSRYESNPANKPDYLRYMDSDYNGTNYYLNNYSGKNITKVNVLAVKRMLDKLKNDSGNTWLIGGSHVGFGLGCIQWTFGRTWELVNRYLNHNQNCDTITLGQVVTAESEMLLNELDQSDYNYGYILHKWKIVAAYQYTRATAENAGELICTDYVVQDNAAEKLIRKTIAGNIYSVMMGENT